MEEGIDFLQYVDCRLLIVCTSSGLNVRYKEMIIRKNTSKYVNLKLTTAVKL